MSSKNPKPRSGRARLDKFQIAAQPLRPLDGGSPRVPNLATDETSLANRMWTLYEGRWLIATIAAAVLAVAGAYLVLATPIYRSVTTIQVEAQSRGIAGLEELSAIFSAHSPTETEIEVLQSRTLLGGVVDTLGLDLDVEPRRFPLIGRALASRHSGEGLAKAPLGLNSFAWGGERIRVGRLDVSDELLDKQLVLTVVGETRFQVEAPHGGLRVSGEVGTVATGKSGALHLDLFVSELTARPGTRFLLRKRRHEDTMDALQKEIRVAEKGKKTGIVVLTLDGPDPGRTSAILSTLSNSFLRQSVERKSAEATKTLEFVESQLPIVKSNLDAAQSALNTFQVSKGLVDLTSSTNSMLARSVEVDKALQEMEMQRAELHQRFTSTHPSLASLNEKVQQLRSERAVIAARLRDVPATEVDSARLLRDVKSSNELYTLLLNKAQELRVVKSKTIGNVRILDPAFAPHKPERPKPALVLALAVVLGLVGGIAGVIVRNALDQGVKDAEEIEAAIGLPVYATIPHSEKQVVAAWARRGGRAPAQPVLAAIEPGAVAVEAIRGLRTSLRFALVESRNNVVVISGPGPGVGKSFVCVNLAYVLASAERRVLLIDCDLRRGGIHRYFDAERQPGLSDAISGTVKPEEVIRKTPNEHLDFLPTGRIPPNPDLLLGSRTFEHLLTWASQSYGFVIVDTPPVLAVSDPALVARLAGVNLLVLRAGQHPVREIVLTVKTLAQCGARVQGVVLNDVPTVHGRYGRFGRYQSYEYQASESEPRKS